MKENNSPLVQKLTQTEKEIQELKESNKKLLAIEEKREKEKLVEAKKKKPIEESIWWKKVVAWASIITAVGTIFNFAFSVFQHIKLK